MFFSFSIVIPLYNKAKHIERCVFSVLNQTYRNFEIIIVNDGSTDNSLEVVSEIKNKKIKIFSQTNKGVSIARNFGVSKSKYNYVCFLDADDTYHSNFLSEINILINKFPYYGMYATNNYFISSKGERKINFNFNELLYFEIKNLFKIYNEKDRMPFSNSNICVNKTIFNQLNGYAENVKLTEDSDLFLKFYLKSKIAYVNKPLSNYYYETNGNTRGIALNEDNYVSKQIQYKIENKKIPIKDLDEAHKFVANQQINVIKKLLLNGKNIKAFKRCFDIKIIKTYPIRSIILILYCFIPIYLIKRI